MWGEEFETGCRGWMGVRGESGQGWDGVGAGSEGVKAIVASSNLCERLPWVHMQALVTVCVCEREKASDCVIECVSVSVCARVC